MIHSIYVIYQIRGVCVKYRRYGTIEFNEDLLAGFLTALKDFSLEVTGGKGEIKVLDMQTYLVLLVFQEGFLVAAAADKGDDRVLGQNALQQVLDEFIMRYRDAFIEWEGNLDLFVDFDEIIDGIMQEWDGGSCPTGNTNSDDILENLSKIRGYEEKGQRNN